MHICYHLYNEIGSHMYAWGEYYTCGKMDNPRLQYTAFDPIS